MTSANLTPEQDRAAGAIVGYFIGDALGLGTHWYYNVAELREKFGWIDGYHKPRDGWYHSGCDAGDLSQNGQLSLLLLQSLADKNEYDEKDFTTRWDGLLDTLDGTRQGGRYTEKDMCDVWKNREDGKPWGERASAMGDTTNSLGRAAILAARYPSDITELAYLTRDNAGLQFRDPLIKTFSSSFASIVAALIRGVKFDDNISSYMYGLVETGKLPYTHASRNAPTRDNEPLPEPDSLLLPGMIAKASHDDQIRIEPASAVANIYGKACALYMVLPCAYYLHARFPDSFEQSVLNAINGGGQNLQRAALTGALSGAQNGLSGIPSKLIDGLKDKDEILRCANLVAIASTERRTIPTTASDSH